MAENHASVLMIKTIHILQRFWPKGQPESHEQVVGTVTLDNGVLRGDTDDANSVIGFPMILRHDDTVIDPKKEPERFFDELPNHLNGIYCRAVVAK
jgi:hypothetical protein